MKSGESNIIDIECNDIHIKEVKKITYRDLDIYAVRRSTGYRDAKCALLDITNRAWWCGYVEVPLSIHNLFKSKGYLDAILSKLDNPNSYNLANVHGGYTYIDYGIPLVLDDNRRMFLGWDYNHCCDTKDCVTYDNVITEGKKVVDSLLKKNKEGKRRVKSIKIEWHPFPEEKPKRTANCIVSISDSGTEYTASSWWDSREKRFEDFLANIITAWAYMPRPYKKENI